MAVATPCRARLTDATLSSSYGEHDAPPSRAMAPAREGACSPHHHSPHTGRRVAMREGAPAPHGEAIAPRPSRRGHEGECLLLEPTVAVEFLLLLERR